MNLTDLLSDRDGFIRLLAQVRGFPSADAMIEQETGIRLDHALNVRELGRIRAYLERLRRLS